MQGWNHALKPNGSIAAICPECELATSFDHKNQVEQTGGHLYKGVNYARIIYTPNQCARCGRGGMAKIHQNSNFENEGLETFFPFSIDNAPVPAGVPDDIKKELREAELCASFGALRGGSALLRSALEKTLIANGYTKGTDPALRDLQKRIDAAAADGIITEVQRKKAHEDIRSLGNDVLHDAWRLVTQDEFDTARHYLQRILECFYDDRPTTEKLLLAKGRLSAAKPATVSN